MDKCTLTTFDSKDPVAQMIQRQREECWDSEVDIDLDKYMEFLLTCPVVYHGIGSHEVNENG